MHGRERKNGMKNRFDQLYANADMGTEIRVFTHKSK